MELGGLKVRPMRACAGRGCRVGERTGVPTRQKQSAREQATRTAARQRCLAPAHPLLALNDRLAAAGLHHVAEQLPQVQRRAVEHLWLRESRQRGERISGGGRLGQGAAWERRPGRALPGSSKRVAGTRARRSPPQLALPPAKRFPSAHARVQAARCHEALPDLSRAKDGGEGREERSSRGGHRAANLGCRDPRQLAALGGVSATEPPACPRTSVNCSRLRTTGRCLEGAAGALAGSAAAGATSGAAAGGSGWLGPVSGSAACSMAAWRAGVGPQAGLAAASARRAL